ncbi:unnamed protein product [Dicrocoelium dendriticum]|nr:unnamed protein product [Dicrocoelium dendriticum]
MYSLPFSPRSTSKHISNVMLAGFIIWYLTMLLPVNVEEKLTVPEILFYHFVLLSILLLFRRLRTVHEDKVRRFSSASHLLQYSPEQELSTPKSGTKHDSISSLSPILWYNPLLGLWMLADINWWFVALLSLYLFFAVYTANLALTSVCTPRMYADWFILPNDCTAVYADFLRAWVFVSSFYWLISTIVPTAVFMHQVVSLVQRCKKSSGAHKDYVIA